MSGDFLLVAFQVRDASKPSRQYLALDLNSLEIEANYQLVSICVCICGDRSRHPVTQHLGDVKRHRPNCVGLL